MSDITKKTCSDCALYSRTIIGAGPWAKERCAIGHKPVLPEIALRSGGGCGPSRAGWASAALSRGACSVTAGPPSAQAPGPYPGPSIPLAPLSWGDCPSNTADESPDHRLIVAHAGPDILHVLDMDSTQPGSGGLRQIVFVLSNFHSGISPPPGVVVVHNQYALSWKLIGARFYEEWPVECAGLVGLYHIVGYSGGLRAHGIQ